MANYTPMNVGSAPKMGTVEAAFAAALFPEQTCAVGMRRLGLRGKFKKVEVCYDHQITFTGQVCPLGERIHREPLQGKGDPMIAAKVAAISAIF